jgi:hypothetical protein
LCLKRLRIAQLYIYAAFRLSLELKNESPNLGNSVPLVQALKISAVFETGIDEVKGVKILMP